ncbi:hypothetical protein [Herbiconiux solani]|uniref:hypothetical protein n=1 Tax=Herbiconiux solani TaxID=661329 RepID=UPI0012EED57A|nr:hypothetical protein [Herbiconiux solani]
MILAASLTAFAAMVSGCTGPGTADQLPTASLGAATAGPGATPSPATAAPDTVVDGLGLAILQNRPDYAKRVLQLAVTNQGTAPITVTAARFSSPQFAGEASWSKPTEVPAGLTRQLPVALPEAVCPAPSSLAGDATLAVTVTDASGASREVVAAPADPFAVLPRIAGEDCLDEAVAAVASLRLDDTLEVTGAGRDAVARLRLVVDPSAGSGSLRVSGARSTILLQPPGGGNWPLETAVDGGGATQVLTLDVVPARCDPHAIAEDKRGTFLPVQVELGDGATGMTGTTGTVSVPSSDALRLALYDFIAQTCGYGTAETAG